MSKVNLGLVAAGGFLTTLAALTANAFATATYDVTPVTSGITSELAANLPVILGIVGALIALGLAMRAVKKFAKV